jgi:hypothetical protein
LKHSFPTRRSSDLRTETEMEPEDAKIMAAIFIWVGLPLLEGG